ncbi:piggyBac transposable element-derived protein 4 [Nephila pilipes]|uniref:PiggyBac transposable element-derived protein 4 n=1 Tax=Nephila pilipes TaxID=299642 RepID=A0A8X6T1U5_NEPPI|nr:piggyBac transposable element-derived protein 4 [Nephila pilipes]
MNFANVIQDSFNPRLLPIHLVDETITNSLILPPPKEEMELATQYLYMILATRDKEELTKNIQGSNRNIRMDNWFTSITLTEKLLMKPMNLTIVGTLRKNIREIPPELLQLRSRTVVISSRKKRRWTLRVSYGEINISLMNINVLHVHNRARKSENILSRKTFAIKLSEDHLTPWMKKYLNIQTLPRSTKVIISEVLNLQDIQSEEYSECKKGKLVHFAHIICEE